MNSPISDFQFKEKISAVAVAAGTILTDLDALNLSVPIKLPERRIYLYIEVAQSVAGAFRFDANVVGFAGGVPVASMPANMADFTGSSPNQSVATIFNAGGSPVGDSLVIRLAQPFVAAITSAVIQPVRINAEVDRLILSVRGLSGANITGWRAYLACLSTKF